MSPAVEKKYNEVVAILKQRKDFESIDLSWVETYAIGCVMFESNPVTKGDDPIIFDLQEFVNEIGKTFLRNG